MKNDSNVLSSHNTSLTKLKAPKLVDISSMTRWVSSTCVVRRTSSESRSSGFEINTSSCKRRMTAMSACTASKSRWERSRWRRAPSIVRSPSSDAPSERHSRSIAAGLIVLTYRKNSSSTNLGQHSKKVIESTSRRTVAFRILRDELAMECTLCLARARFEPSGVLTWCFYFVFLDYGKSMLDPRQGWQEKWCLFRRLWCLFWFISLLSTGFNIILPGIQ